MKKRDKFLEFQREYRLENPLYNWIYKYNSKNFGLLAGFISSFFWSAVFDWQTIVKNGPKVFLFSLLTGLLAWNIYKITLKEFEKKSREEGFENGHYNFSDDDLR